MDSMTRRAFTAGAAAPLLRSAGARERPNIILIVTDDQRYDAFSASGFGGLFRFLKTPHMDRLAREGVHFRNAFCTTSLCSPARASMLTGQYMRTHRVNSLQKGFAGAPRLFPHLLRDAGYETGFIGKWHIGAHSDQPVDAFHRWVAFRHQGDYVNPLLNVDGTSTPSRGYVTDILTDYAVEFLTRRRNAPFFLHLSHKAPHDPCTPPPRLEALFANERIDYPASYYEDHTGKPAWFLNSIGHDWFHILFHPRENFERYVKNYARCLAAVDESLGRVLKALDDTGQAENTAIFYTSDNGHFMAEHQMFTKMLMYEESIRVPLLVRYPAHAPRGVRRDELVLNVDIAPTVAELAGVAVPTSMEGRSFRGLLEDGRAPAWRRSFLYEYEEDAPYLGLPQMEGVRTADGWQYTRFPDWEQLFDIRSDPAQMRNLAADPKYAAKKQQLIAELRRLGGGQAPLRGPGPYKRRSEPVHTPHRPDFAASGR